MIIHNLFFLFSKNLHHLVIHTYNTLYIHVAVFIIFLKDRYVQQEHIIRENKTLLRSSHLSDDDDDSGSYIYIAHTLPSDTPPIYTHTPSPLYMCV